MSLGKSSPRPSLWEAITHCQTDHSGLTTEQAGLTYEAPADIGPSLTVIESSGRNRDYPLDAVRVRIGRVDDNDIVLNENSVSRYHAEILFEHGQYVVQDKNSTNGIFVNDERVFKQVLSNGCEFELGSEKIQFSYKAWDVPQEQRLCLMDCSSALSNLDPDTKQKLSPHIAMRFFPKGSFVLEQKSPMESIYVVVSGRVHLLDINDEGGERIIEQLAPGHSFGEQCLLPGQMSPWHIAAVEPTWLIELSQNNLEETASGKPSVENTVSRTIHSFLSTGVYNLKNKDAFTPSTRTETIELIGRNRQFLAAAAKVAEIVAEGRTPIIAGLPGTGKTTVARHSHQISHDGDKPCLEVSLSELDPLNVDGAIFGVEADANSPHLKGKKGYLEILNGGTLVISHAELMSAHLQSKLLTYLKNGWFHKQYGQIGIKTEVKIIILLTGETSEVLNQLIPELRQALDNQIVVLPPLSKRLKDIPLLAEHFLAQYAKKAAKEVSGLSREARERLVTYSWPANISELENVIQRAVSVSVDGTIIPGDLIFVTSREKDFHKLNILRNDRTRRILRSPFLLKPFMWFNMLMVTLVAAITIYGGLQAPDDPLRHMDTNPGMLATWLIWFPLLPVSALFLGRIWCGMCPIVGIGHLCSKLVNLNLPVPKIFRRLDFWLLAAAFLFLDFIEEFIEVAHEPLSTGLLLAAIVLASVIFCILYERKAFCRYLCPLAGLLGTYATVSPVEIRGNKKVCQTQCGDHSCFKGTDALEGCPLSSYPASISSNAECMMCGNCLKNCENRGVQVNLRPPMQELWRKIDPKLSISLFGVILIGLMARHQFSELPWWEAKAESLALSSDAIYTLLYLGFILLAVIFFCMSSILSGAASNQKVSRNMATYGMAFIPLALAGHIAHVTHEVLEEGVYELLAYGQKLWDLLVKGISIAQSQVVVPHFIHDQVVALLKFMIIFGGFTASLIALIMIARRVSRQNIFGRSMPHFLTLLVFSSAYFVIFLA